MKHRGTCVRPGTRLEAQTVLIPERRTESWLGLLSLHNPVSERILPVLPDSSFFWMKAAVALLAELSF
jgi:hypothetical protein